MTGEHAALCPDDRLAQVLGTAQADDALGLTAVDALLTDYPRDPRLHFLRGSLLAGLKHYPEARKAMATAIDVAPEYALARFQLGLLELTSGDGAAALATWAPLLDLPQDSPLRLFATALDRFIHDDFAGASELLQAGIAANTELPQMNGDMQLFIEECRKALDDGGPADDEPTSAVQQLLQQSGKSTRH